MIAGYSINDKGPAKISTVTREAFFIEFAQAIRRELNNTPLIVTGGFRTREGMERAVASGACDIVGIGRPAVLCPDLPCKVIFNKDVVDSDAKLRTEAKSADWLAAILGIKMLARGRETVRTLHMLKLNESLLTWHHSCGTQGRYTIFCQNMGYR